MPESDFLTIVELAKHLGKPESSLRSWRDRFRAFIPTKTAPRSASGTGVDTLYSRERFEEIYWLVEYDAKQKPNMSLQEVSNVLAARYPIEADAAGIPIPALLRPELAAPGAARSAAPQRLRGADTDVAEAARAIQEIVRQQQAALGGLAALPELAERVAAATEEQRDELRLYIGTLSRAVEAIETSVTLFAEAVPSLDAAVKESVEASKASAALVVVLADELRAEQQQRKHPAPPRSWWASLFSTFRRLGWHTAVLGLLLMTALLVIVITCLPILISAQPAVGVQTPPGRR